MGLHLSEIEIMLHKSLYVPEYASNAVVKRDYENLCPHGLLFINKAHKCGEVRMLMILFLESRALSKFKINQHGKYHSVIDISKTCHLMKLIRDTGLI